MTCIALCIATTGRPAILAETLRNVVPQTRRPDTVVVCPIRMDDVGEAAAALPFAVRIVTGSPGLAAQRNTLLRAVPSADLVLFIDDDFLLAPDFIARMEETFARETDCVVLTGQVAADGIAGPGLSVDEGRRILASHVGGTASVAPIFTAYGCNMAINWARLRATPCLFDENLPLYAWAEDVDFSRQASAHGRVLKATSMVGVHLGAKSGRVSGVRFGYSQVANQVYLARKGTIPFGLALRKALENVAANLLGTIRNDEAHVDRRGRLIGNLYGLRDLVTFRLSPLRILTM